MSKQMKINKTMCKTCPWREGSPYAFLRSQLELSAMTCASRICHSTGENNAINEHTGVAERLCRGARDHQLKCLHAIGFLSAPTDEAWSAKCAEMKIEQDRTR